MQSKKRFGVEHGKLLTYYLYFSLYAKSNLEIDKNKTEISLFVISFLNFLKKNVLGIKKIVQINEVKNLYR